MRLFGNLLSTLIIGVAGGIEYIRLKHACSYPVGSSAESLRRILTLSKDTLFGKAHNFETILGAQTDEQLYFLYKKFVPAGDYETMRQYVDLAKQGQSDVLFKGKPIMYATTSGTTNLPKWLPVSKIYIDKVYKKMSRAWLYQMLKNKPGVFTGKILTVVSPAVECYAPDGTPCGSVSGFTASRIPAIIRRQYAVPFCVYRISDYLARYYTLMRFSIEQNITILATANPSTVNELLKNASEYMDEYISDIEKGTLSDKFTIEPEIREELEMYLKPNPKRARRLRELREMFGHELLPKHYWPNLQILSTWKCANAAVFARQFEGKFAPCTLHQEMGYFASECRFGMALDDSINTVLFPHFHFYEFVEEHEIRSKNPHFLRLNELKVGKRYCPYITTLSGLYRYNMNDLVQTGPLYHNTPTIHMVQKINGITSITGEKLYEKQFIDAVHEAEDITGMKTKFFVGFADVKESCYDFYYEFESDKVSPEQAAEFTTRIDEVLERKNIEYFSKRKSQRLNAPGTFILVKDAFEKFKRSCLEEGFRDGQFKMVLLLQDEKKRDKFNNLVKSVVGNKEKQ